MNKPNARELLDELVSGGFDPHTSAQLASRVEKLLILHKMVRVWRGMGHDYDACEACHEEAPCPTIIILNGEE